MKIFQIYKGYCYWDASRVLSSLEEAAEKFAADMVFAEAPDYVFEGWGFDGAMTGDARFIRPTPPKGWLYDGDSGTFYPADGEKPSDRAQSVEALARENAELKKELKEIRAMLAGMVAAKE